MSDFGGFILVFMLAVMFASFVIQGLLYAFFGRNFPIAFLAASAVLAGLMIWDQKRCEYSASLDCDSPGDMFVPVIIAVVFSGWLAVGLLFIWRSRR
ncbi:MAG: hypothetical protein ACT4OU_02215 [Hyphomicrobium sp.]